MITWKDISALTRFLRPFFTVFVRIEMLLRRHFSFVILLLFVVNQVRADVPPPGVHDVRGYEIRDSGYIVPNPAGMQLLYWIDDDRLLFIGHKSTSPRQTAQVPAQRQVDLRLRLWDLRTNQVTVHLDTDVAHGSLCVKGQYVVFRYTSREDEEKKVGRRFVFEGLFGREKLSIAEFPKPASRRDAFISRDDATKNVGDAPKDQKRIAKNKPDFVEFNYLTCRHYRRSELPALGGYVRPLLPGEFVTREYAQDDEQARNKLPGTYWYHPPSGKPIPLKLVDKDAGIGRYFSYRDSYVLGEISAHVIISEKVPRRYGLMDRKGNIQDYTPPNGPWMNGTTHIAPTRQGLFLTSSALFGSGGYLGGNGAAGAYLLIERELKRLAAGIPSAFDISPDGCRIALAIADQSEDESSIRRLKMLDLCSKGG